MLMRLMKILIVLIFLFLSQRLACTWNYELTFYLACHGVPSQTQNIHLLCTIFIIGLGFVSPEMKAHYLN
jgi:hypothetical protein